MRQRVTYLLPRGAGVNPADISAGKDELTFSRAAEAATERRITLGLSELPHSVRDFVQDFHELHVRVVSPRNHQAFTPAVSTLPPGLHVFFTPPTRHETKANQLCTELGRLLGVSGKELICNSAPESYSRPPVLSERFASSSTYQFYHGVDDLDVISKHIGNHLCPGLEVASTTGQLCKVLADTSGAESVDYDFDVINHAVTITIISPPAGKEGTGRTHKLQPDDRLEVGILSPEQPEEPEELKMGGYLTVVGEDDKPKPTMFSFPARHHPLPADDRTSYITSFQKPTGLHPKLEISLPARDLQSPKPEGSCSLHAYMTTPSTLFLDRYQFDDNLFLASQNLVALRALSGEEDLEAPNWVAKQWGSAALLELAAPTAADREKNNWLVTIPMHLRYLNATASESGHTPIDMPWPVVFWACEAEEGLKMATNPFDRVNLGYDGLFGPKTMFYHIPASASQDRLVEQLQVPVLDPAQATWVPMATLAAVLAGFAWVCWKLFGHADSPTVLDEKINQVSEKLSDGKARDHKKNR